MHYNHSDSTPQSVLDYDAAGQLGLKGNATGFPQITGLTSTQGGFLFTNSSGAPPPPSAQPTPACITTISRPRWERHLGPRQSHLQNRRGVAKGPLDRRRERRHHGVYNVSAAETGLPYLQATTLGGGNIGFPYASFLLGAVDNATVKNRQDPQLRKAAWGCTCRIPGRSRASLTLDYGARWDYQTAAKEMNDRFAMFGPSVPNPSAGGLPGAPPTKAPAGEAATAPSPPAIRWPSARASGSPTNGFQDGSARRVGIHLRHHGHHRLPHRHGHQRVGWNQLSFSTGSFGTPAVQLQMACSSRRRPWTVASRSPGLFPSPGQINSPPYYIDRSGGRPPRINQWNISAQRQITSNLVVEAAFVATRASGFGPILWKA